MVAQYFSAAAAAQDALSIRGAGGVATVLGIAQDLLDAISRGEDLTSRNFAVDIGVDVTVALASGAGGAAVGAYVGGLMGSAVPVVGTAIGIVAGAGIGYIMDSLIQRFDIKEFLKGQDFNVTVPTS